MGRAIARLHTDFDSASGPDFDSASGPELGSYRTALLKLTRRFFPKQDEALLFLQRLAQELPEDNWSGIVPVVCSVTAHLQAGKSWLKDHKFLHSEIRY